MGTYEIGMCIMIGLASVLLLIIMLAARKY
jgi:hypothetical protein